MGRGKPHLEFMPLEHWHIRHFRGSGLVDGPDPCRRTSNLSSVLAVDNVRKRVTLPAEEATFPESWAAEYEAALGNFSLAVGESYAIGLPVTMGRFYGYAAYFEREFLDIA